MAIHEEGEPGSTAIISVHYQLGADSDGAAARLDGAPGPRRPICASQKGEAGGLVQVTLAKPRIPCR